MKRRILYPIYMLALLLALGSCQDEDWKGGQVTDTDCLTLSVSTMAASRAEVAGEDRFNENTITRADVYFFSSDAEQNESQTCLYAHLSVPVSNNTLQVQLDKDIITDGNTYYIYVVANYDLLNGASATSKTLADLKGTVLTTNWKDGYSGNTGPEPSLVMDGATTVTISPEGTSGHVDLKRAMAKVMLFPTAEDKITVGEGDELVTYRPVLDRMRVTMVYGVNKTNLAGTYQVQANRDYITRMLRDYRQISGENDYEQVAPFYSYPNPEETTDRKDTYLILCVPWYVDGGAIEQAVNYYYRVPITGDDSPALMERNKYYEVHTKIGVLGSLSPHDAVTVSSDFIIHDWFSMDIDAAMNNYRYLVLDEYTSVMNNVDRLEMPYISSSPIDWERTHIVSVEYMDYHNTQSYKVTLNSRNQSDANNRNSTVDFTDFTLSQGENNTLVIGHQLNNDDDFVPYTITVEVWNTDDVQADTWTITQYPAMYIEGEFNENGGDNRFVNGYHRITDSWGSNNVPYDDNRNQIGSVSDWAGNNANRNLYTINITSFEADTYAIGDPRSESYYDFEGDLDATQYKETRADAENVISPAYMVASSWGKTTALSYDAAKKRCASYQEGGYPAGRWRIPTKAEVEYIVGLSEERKIPRLFGEVDTDTNYWVSSGYYNTDTGYHTGTNSVVYVRCVYDVWYWGNTTIEEDEHNTSGLTNEDFVWGDSEDGTLTRGTEH